MAIDSKRAQAALKAAGARGLTLCGLFWPLGKEKRLRALLHERRAALEAKNHVIDFLHRTQGRLAELKLTLLEHVLTALEDPQSRRLVATLGASRAMIEDDLTSRHGSEVGRPLDQALLELVAEGVVLQVPAQALAAQYDVYLAVQNRQRPHYDVAELSGLLREGRQYGTELRSRARREEQTGRTRTYRM